MREQTPSGAATAARTGAAAGVRRESSQRVRRSGSGEGLTRHNLPLRSDNKSELATLLFNSLPHKDIINYTTRKLDIEPLPFNGDNGIEIK